MPYFGNNTPADKALWWKIAGSTAACTITGTGTSGTFRCAAREYSGQNLLPQGHVENELRQGGTTWLSGVGLSANIGDLVVAGIAGGTASDIVTAGAAGPNSNLTKLDNNANGYIAIEDEPNWPGGVVNASFGLSVGGSTPDGFAYVFGPCPYQPAFSPRGMPGGV